MRKTSVLVLLPLALLACSSDGGGSGADVSMTNDRKFEPEEFTVSAGATVTWSNDSAESHTVTAYEEELPSSADFFASGGATSEEDALDNLSDGLVDNGETFEFTFDEPGTYRYYCIPHESTGMTGTIVVEE